jgi:general secretion pathway protein G
MNTKIGQAGFSLLELLVVMVIISLLAGLVGPRLFGQADKAKQQAASTQIKMIKGALETMYLDIGRFPKNDEGLELLANNSNSNNVNLWNGPYLDEEVPLDPWGNPYQYQFTESGGNNRPFYLYSFGSDGQQGGDGMAEDIGYVENK